MDVRVKGNFKKLIFSNDTSNFYVFSFKLMSDQTEAKKLLGLENQSNINVFFHRKNINMSLDYEIDIEVKKSNNPKYKYSYTVKSIQYLIIKERDKVIRYLSSSLFKGISSRIAEKVVNNLGVDFIDSIEKYEDSLISLIGQKRASIIQEGIKNNNEVNEITKIFIKENLSTAILEYLTRIKPIRIREYLTNDCFKLLEVDNIIFNFSEVDKIAKYFFKDYSQDLSNRYLIYWIIRVEESNGSTSNNIKDIYNQLLMYRQLKINEFKEYIKDLILEEKLYFDSREKEYISSMINYKKELFICQRLKEISSSEFNTFEEDKIITKEGIDEVQKVALLNSLNNGLSIITGGPGTGKTFLIDLLVRNFKKFSDLKIDLLAPTGKAATQISLRTAMGAKTIHSFLKWNKISFEINESNPSDVEILIIDEFSMINIDLFYSLLIGCPDLKQVILIGDKDQLPSIGAGYLLNDLIYSNKFLVNKLEKIYRSNEGSLIARNSILIKNGSLPMFDNNECRLIDIEKNNLDESIIKNLDEYLSSNNDLFDYQILIPKYNYKYGIDSVNLIVQRHINKNNQPLFKIKENYYYENDKIIQLENDNELNVFNGEIGKIVGIRNNKLTGELEEILVEYNSNKIITYTPSEFSTNTKLAYAISIHKFQGSECANVFLIIANEHMHMLSKKLFYTGFTRAKNRVSILSTKSIIQSCVNNDFDSKRKCNILTILNSL